MGLVVVHTRSMESNNYSPYKEKKKSHSISLYTNSILFSASSGMKIKFPFFFQITAYQVLYLYSIFRCRLIKWLSFSKLIFVCISLNFFSLKNIRSIELIMCIGGTVAVDRVKWSFVTNKMRRVNKDDRPRVLIVKIACINCWYKVK